MTTRHLTLMLLLASTILVAMFTRGQSEAQPASSEAVVLSGEQLMVLESAVREFRSHDLEVSDYRITLDRVGYGYRVLFEDPEMRRPSLGASSRMHEMRVELTRDARVIEWQFL